MHTPTKDRNVSTVIHARANGAKRAGRHARSVLGADVDGSPPFCFKVNIRGGDVGERTHGGCVACTNSSNRTGVECTNVLARKKKRRVPAKRRRCGVQYSSNGCEKRLRRSAAVANATPIAPAEAL